MPVQRKDEDTISTTVVLPRVLYNEALKRGYNIREVFKIALVALLKLDDEALVRYQNIVQLREQLETNDYKVFIEEAERKAAEKEAEQAKETEQSQRYDEMLQIVLDECKPDSKGFLGALKAALNEGRLTAEVMKKQIRRMRAALKDYSDLTDENILQLIEDAVKKWSDAD